MRKLIFENNQIFELNIRVSNIKSPSNLIQNIEIFLTNIDDFSGLLSNKIGEISNFFEIEIKKLDKKYFENMDSMIYSKKTLSLQNIDRKSVKNHIKSSFDMNVIKNNQQLLIQSYQKSLELVKLLEIYSNLCINIFIKNYTSEDILHAKTNMIMKKIYDKINLEKKLLIT